MLVAKASVKLSLGPDAAFNTYFILHKFRFMSHSQPASTALKWQLYLRHVNNSVEIHEKTFPSLLASLANMSGTVCDCMCVGDSPLFRDSAVVKQKKSHREKEKMGRPFSTVFGRYVSDLSIDHKYSLSAWHPPLFLSSFPPAFWVCVWEQVFDVLQYVRHNSFTQVYHTLLCPSCHTIIIFLLSCHSSTCSPHARSIASEWFSRGSSHPVLMRSACRTTP